MSLIVRHAKVSTVPDGDDPSVVRPSDWNDDHVVEGAVPSDFQAPIIDGFYYSTSVVFAGIDAPSQDVLLAVPFWCSHEVTWTKIGITVTTPQDGALVRLGVYASDANNRPGALLLDAGEVDASTEGEKELSISLTLAANTVVWLASNTNTNGVLEGLTAFGSTGSNGPWGGWVLGGASSLELTDGIALNLTAPYGPLPDPFGVANASGNQCILPWLRTGV